MTTKTLSRPLAPIFLSLVLAFWAGPATAQDAEDAWRRGHAALQSGDLELAASELGSAVEGLPEAVEPAYLLGVVEYRRGRPEAALEAFRLASSRPGAGVREGLASARLALELGASDEAWSRLTDLDPGAMAPEKRPIWLDLLERSSQGVEATPARLERLGALRGLGDDPILATLAAEWLGRLGREVESAALWDRVLRQAGSAELALRALRSAFDSLNSPESARAALSWPGEAAGAEATLIRAELEARAGEATRAESRLTALLASDPGNAQALYRRSLLRIDLGQDGAAIKDLGAALATLPPEQAQAASARRSLARALQREGRLEEAQKAYRRAGEPAMAERLGTALAQEEARLAECRSRLGQLVELRGEWVGPHDSADYRRVTREIGELEQECGTASG